MSTEARWRTLALAAAIWPWAFATLGGLLLHFGLRQHASDGVFLAIAFLVSPVAGGYAAVRLGRRGIYWGPFGGLFGGLPFFFLAALGRSKTAVTAGSTGRSRSELAAELAAAYSMQYVLDRGSMPSRETVIAWLSTMQALTELEILELGSDMEKCKRTLERR